jgi:hypothetical protein
MDMTLSKSKQALADAIHASGKGWPDGADSAVQDKDMWICIYEGKPTRHGEAWQDDGNCIYKLGFAHDKLLPNWHQTVLSRDEYFSAYPEKVEPVTDEIESLEDVLAPATTDTLLTAWQSAQAATREARAALEAAEQAEREAEEAVKAVLGKYGWGESVVEVDEGWIEWGGGECPVEEGTLIDVRYRDGEEKFGLNALWNEDGRDSSENFWHNDDYNVDIVAYRLHRP